MAVSMRTRVLIEDARSHGGFLRVTWHPEVRQFVVSNWEGAVCVGATRVPLESAAELISLLADGMAEVLANERPRTTPAPETLGEHLQGWWRGRRHKAAVLPLRRADARTQRPGSRNP